MTFCRTMGNYVERCMKMFDIKTLLNKITEFKKKETTSKSTNVLVTINKKGGLSAEQTEHISIPARYDDIDKPIFLSTCFDALPNNDYIAYFKNGKLFDVQPRNKKLVLSEERHIAYQARYIISDGQKYDLENPDSISNINIPEFYQITEMTNVTFDLSYILKMRSGKEYRPEITVPLIFKTANLMLNSPIGWNKKDYFRLVIQLWHIGEIFYADYLLKELEKRLPFMVDDDYFYKKSFEKALEHSELFKHDYIISGHLGVTCEKCSPYQDRIYSLSGKDKHFPKLPQFILDNKGLHCKVPFYSTDYYKGKTLTQYIYKSEDDFVEKEVDALKYSNRPFVDDRDIYAKKRYDNWLVEEEKRKETDRLYYNREHRINEYKLHLEYHQIVMLMHEKAPKSYGGYMRMKKNNTTNFQKIVNLAKENGVVINNL